MDNEPTASAGPMTRGKRKRLESEPTELSLKGNHTPRGPYRSKIITRSSTAKDRALARSEQNEYVPQNHRTYSPLNRKLHDIRILVLKAGQPHMPLECHLLQLPLNKAQEIGFETISYCWGDPKDQAVIDVEGFPLRVPISAIEALQQFRYLDEDRFLWLDSICLNQADLEERGHEVARMHRIYSCGKRNLIWLGLDDGTAAAASHALHAITDDIDSHPEMRKVFHQCLRPAVRPPDFSQRFSFWSRFALPLLNLFTRPWFSRLWVAQEALSASQNRVYCGNIQMDLVNMLRVHMWLCENLRHSDDDIYGLLPVLAATIDKLHWSTDSAFGGSNKMVAHSVAFKLWALQGLDAADPRDHVYGALGLLHNNEDGNIPLLLQPDYSKDALTVFCDATRYAIYQDANLAALSFTKHEASEVSCSQR